MRRLHLSIFGALVAAGLCCTALVFAISSVFRSDSGHVPHFVRDMGALVLEGLPDRDRPGFERGLLRRARRLNASISVWDRDGTLLGRAGKPLARPDLVAGRETVFSHGRDGLFIRLEDGRLLAVAFHRIHDVFGPRRLAMSVLALVMFLMAGSYLAARRITRRLELLERGVTRFGEGELETRVPVAGKDEVAQLSRAFNRAFERISGLVRTQRRMLQSASHELRSPLSRLRMAFELLREPGGSAEQRERLCADAERDIAELDALIADLLLAGRLADAELPRDFARVSLPELLQEEAGRVGAKVELAVPSAELWVNGNARMLRSMLRNLLENAKRYGREPISATLGRAGAELEVWVDDRGVPLPEAERARIFEAFYRPAGHREGKDGGVGLGLSLVRSIAEHHAGSARYLAHEGHSRFEVRLPAASGSPLPKGEGTR
jgi:signal transduction histidine kinase